MSFDICHTRNEKYELEIFVNVNIIETLSIDDINEKPCKLENYLEECYHCVL
jgi:hypothetical protein